MFTGLRVDLLNDINSNLEQNTVRSIGPNCPVMCFSTGHKETRGVEDSHKNLVVGC